LQRGLVTVWVAVVFAAFRRENRLKINMTFCNIVSKGSLSCRETITKNS
jgi:hypothetical protein